MRTKLLLVAFFTICFFACDDQNKLEEELEFFYESPTEKIQVGVWSEENGRMQEESIEVRTTVSASEYIPEEIRKDEIELEKYVTENGITGEVTFFIDGQISNEIEFDGLYLIDSSSDLQNQRSVGIYGCSWSAVQSCTQESIRSQGIVAKIACAFSGPSCIAIAMADCTLTLCTDIQ